jgi:hypothetical protein
MEAVMKNITLSAGERLIEEARERARREHYHPERAVSALARGVRGT